MVPDTPLSINLKWRQSNIDNLFLNKPFAKHLWPILLRKFIQPAFNFIGSLAKLLLTALLI